MTGGTLVPAPDRAAIAKGWRSSPVLLFRDGIAVPEDMFDRETGAGLVAVPPAELRFREGGQFP